MNLNKKKILASKALKVGKNRILFNNESLADIEKAITKQDIKSLYNEGVILIKPVKGRKKIKKRKIRKGPGKTKKKINKRKQTYVKITRKLRSYLKYLKKMGIIKKDLYWGLRKKIRGRAFKSRAALKEYLKSVGIELERVSNVKGKIEKKIEKSKTKKDKESKSEVDKEQNSKSNKLLNTKSKKKIKIEKSEEKNE